MIIDRKPKAPLPDDPMDSPPSYDTLVPLSSRLLQDRLDEKRSNGPSDCGFPFLCSPTSPFASSASSRSPSGPSTSGSSKGKGKSKSNNWFNFAAMRTTREVHTTVLSLVRDLVRNHYADSEAPAGVLQSCADACAGYDLQLPSILQERSVEGHTPIYWAIIKRKPDEQLDDKTQIPDLVTALLSHCSPLTADTIADIRLACLVTSDQKLFHRLRMLSEFSTVSGVDEILMGVTGSQDEIEVHELEADDGSFAVDLVIPHFQKRMRVAERIDLEFIARNRLWKFAFAVAKPDEYHGIPGGSWCITISLQENSSPTWLDARLVISDPEEFNCPSPLITLDSRRDKPSGSESSIKPPITIPLRDKVRKLEAPGQGYSPSIIAVSLADNDTAGTLQYSGTTFIASDEKLRARLEATLRKPTSPDGQEDCIIC